MAEKKKKEEKGPSNIGEVVDGIMSSGDFKKDYEAIKKFIHPNYQIHVEKLSHKLFDSLYQSSVDGIFKRFGSDIAGKVNDEEKLQDLLSEYITDFLKVYSPKILKGPLAQMKDKKQIFRLLAAHYDRALGLDAEHSIRNILEKFKEAKEANVGDLIMELTEITKGGKDQRFAHRNLLKNALQSKAINAYVIPHHHEYISKVLDEAKETVDKDAEISDEERADFTIAALQKPYTAVQKHSEIIEYHIRKPKSGPGDEIGYKRRQKPGK